MASALGNPNDRRRINKITRHVMTTSATPAAAVGQWLSARTKAKSARPKWMQRGDGKAAMAHVASGKAKKQTKNQKKAYAAMRSLVRREFQRQDPGGYKKSTRYVYGKKRTKSYSSRAGGSHASRYYKKSKKSTMRPGRGFVKGNYHVLDVSDVNHWTKERARRRKAGKKGHTTPWGAGKRKAKRAAPGKAGWQQQAKSLGVKYVGRKKSAVLADIAAKSGALTNPTFVPMGDLALTNPRVMGASNYFLGYAIPVTIAGAAAGGLHALASSSGLTAKLGDLVDKVPGVGPVVADNLPFTLQGLVVGSAFGILAPMVGGTAGRYLALAGGAALVFGGGIDAFNYAIGSSEAAKDAAFEDELNIDLSADMDDLDSVLADEGLGSLALGDLALSNMGDLAMTNGLGDGMAYETAPIGAAPSSEDYGQSSLADAHYSGADFSPTEGQALMNGKGAFARRFGHAPVRHSRRTASGPSHLAGREGHRWGWLVRMVGWQRAQQIAALPPKRRVQFLRRMRQAAIQSFNQLRLEAQALQEEHQHQAHTEFAPAAGTAATGASGAAGQTNYLGDPALFMGA